jgi:hypothetical protein
MSDTPRMDAECARQNNEGWSLPDTRKFGHKLERELNKIKEDAERYRLDANRFEAEVMMLKEKLKEYDDTLTVCTDNFSCKTFVPQKWELPPYDEQGKGTPIQ